MQKLIVALVMFGTIYCAASVWEALARYDRQHNYAEADARVTEVEAMCYLQKIESNGPRATETMNCDKAERLSTVLSRKAGWELKYNIRIDYTYTSPVDQQPHQGRMQLAAFPGGKKFRAAI